MEYFYNQNKNHGYHDQPTHPTGHAMATAAMILGVGAMVTCWTFYIAIFLGCLGIAFAILSKGFDKKMLNTAKLGTMCSIAGIIIALITLVGSAIFLINNPEALIELGKQSDQMVQQMYGQSTDSLLGNSYEDIMKQFLESFP